MDLYQIIATVILLTFYAAYIAKGVLLKRQGVTSNRLVKGDKSSSVRWLEYVLLAVTYGMVILQVASIYLLPILVEMPPLRNIGLVITLVGVMFFIAAIVIMKDSWRAGIDSTQRTELVRTGIYRYSRNPAFVGFDLLYIGTTLCFPNVYLIALSLCGVILFHMQILSEEKYLKETFGNEYIGYMASVRRYLGRKNDV